MDSFIALLAGDTASSCLKKLHVPTWEDLMRGFIAIVQGRVLQQQFKVGLLKRLRCVQGLQVVLVVKNLPANAGRCKRRGFNLWVRKIPWRRACQPTPAFFPGKSHGQRSLVGYSPQGHKESDTTEATQHAHTTVIYLLVYFLSILFVLTITTKLIQNIFARKSLLGFFPLGQTAE